MKKATGVFAALLVAAIFTLGIESCGKYEEGPGLTVLPKKARLTREWVGDVWIDGATGTSASITDDAVMEYKKDGVVTYTSGGLSISGTWAFSSDKEDIQTTFSWGGGVATTESAKILRLTTKELWFIETDGSNDETHYKAK